MSVQMIDMVQCPICLNMFKDESIAVHSSVCGVDEAIASEKEPSNVTKSFQDEIEDARKKINMENIWLISVVRSNFDETSLDQLIEASIDDWHNKMNVKFINEEGVDAGGLTREFFSLLFKNQNLLVIEEGNFTLSPENLENQLYLLLGRAVALAILNGHPGPKCFNDYICKYIIYETIPQFGGIADFEIKRADAKAALEEIQSANEENIDQIFRNNIDILSQTGFTKQLTMGNIQEAQTAIKGYFLFYRTMAPLLQFMEGLKFLDMINILRKYPEEGIMYLKNTVCTSPEDIIKFYKACYSTEKPKKDREESIMYNFEKFLKRLGRGKISTSWVQVDTGEEKEITVTTGHLLQSLLGCQFLPPNLSTGLIVFDHESERMTHVNTCAPSITFSNISHLKMYKNFEDIFLNIIVCAYGFGRE